ncbi:transmembrane protein, putative (macronuclear) [Tetrahymena thermophila SB210]|uniref:Transmembrane protein, putative n=1 Tax=Tetrahymena thermophila (strain SB210) TaxID=312017 RepID=Q23PP3_TETTS|nr:transmembrane protein, putative [Tetrahymena thermophila SB210]EAR98642.2 transmembrane protein, putative [Tetrahymena thermophila SB210]|eukprot:XP_001018887.2 transmembrane protein, putative [Tetrahymena thermophila SB210]
MVVMLIDKILSVVIVIIKYSYLQTWILDALNLTFLIKYSQLYFPEHQSMLTYAIYIKVIPALVIQLVYMYLQGSVFCGIDGNQTGIFLAYLQLNILNLFMTVKALFVNSEEFVQIQNGNADFSNRKILLENSKDLFNTFCLYNMWAVILTQPKSSYLYQNVSLWCVIIYFLSLILEFNKTKQFKSTVYALCSFEISLKNLKSMHTCNILMQKQINISHKNKSITQSIDIILQDTKSSHFILLKSLSLFYDYFEIDSSIMFQEDYEKDPITEVEKFYFFSKIFEILIKRNGSILIQSFLKTENGNQVTLINKNFKFNEQLQLSLLSSSQYLPDISMFNIQFNKENCNKIIQERYSKGILFDNTFYQALQEKQQQMHETSAKVLKNSMLQIYAFQKQLKYLVMNNPSQVLFDLYE